MKLESVSLAERLVEALEAGHRATRIVIDVEDGRLVWQVYSGPRRLVSVPVAPREISAVTEATEWILRAETGTPPAGGALLAALTVPAAGADRPAELN